MTPLTVSASPPNWVTAKRFSSTLPEPGTSTAHAHIFTPTTELPFAGHPTVGCVVVAEATGARPISTLQVPAGLVQVTYDRRA